MTKVVPDELKEILAAHGAWRADNTKAPQGGPKQGGPQRGVPKQGGPCYHARPTERLVGFRLPLGRGDMGARWLPRQIHC